MRPIKIIFLALLLAALVPVSPALAQRSIPDDNLGYPVLIRTPSGNTGSGVFVNTSGAVFLVTAKHVLFDKDSNKLRDQQAQLLSYSKDPAEREGNIEVLDLATLDKAGLIKAHATHDVMVVKLGNVVPKEGDDVSRQSMILPMVGANFVRASGLVTAGHDIIKRFDKVMVGNEVILYGYPVSLALEKNHQLEPLRPLLRKGIVAGQNFQNQSIVLDCPAYPGNSGGPVIQIETTNLVQKSLSLIGIVAEYVPFENHGRTFATNNNSGYSIATPMDFVLELTEQMQQPASN